MKLSAALLLLSAPAAALAPVKLAVPAVSAAGLSAAAPAPMAAPVLASAFTSKIGGARFELPLLGGSQPLPAPIVVTPAPRREAPAVPISEGLLREIFDGGGSPVRDRSPWDDPGRGPIDYPERDFERGLLPR